MVYALTIDNNGNWLLAGDEDPIIRVRVEYSKSSRAKCRFCNQVIEKDTMRIGKPIKWKTWISSWRHPACFYIDDGGAVIADEEVSGMDCVTNDKDIKILRDALARVNPPGSSLDPENDEFTNKKIISKRIATPIHMTTKLLPFQEEGLSWLVSQEEESKVHGGLLCDQMGMGKTIQTLSLVVHRKAHGLSGPTLVVAPSSAMLQWFDEAKNNVESNFLKIFVYHGNNRRAITPLDLLQHDIVLTSYPILEYEYRRCLNRMKVPCEYCGKMYLPRKLELHNAYFCGPNSVRTTKLAMRDRNEESAKKKETMKKAMKTLDIGQHSLPTPSNIYKDLMKQANRQPVSMYVSRSKAKELQETTTVESPDAADLNATEVNVSPVQNSAANAPPSNVDFAKLNVWHADSGKCVLYRSSEKRCKWYSNLTLENENHIQFTQSRVLKNAQHITLKSESLWMRVDGHGQSWICTDGGKSWQLYHAGLWIQPTEDMDATWLLSGKHVGKMVLRHFAKQNVVGSIVAYAKKVDDENPELWKVIHLDGDCEDLDKDEIKDALTDFASFEFPPYTDLIEESKPEPPVEKSKTPAKKSSKTKSKASETKRTTPKRSPSRKVLKKGSNSDSGDSEFESPSESDETSSSTEESPTDEEDSSESDSEPLNKKRKSPSKVNRVPVSVVPRPGTSVSNYQFQPAKWGPGSKEAKTLAYFLKKRYSTSKGKKGKQPKRRKLDRGDSKSKNDSSSKWSDSDEDDLKKAKTTRKGKKLSSGSKNVDSESDEDWKKPKSTNGKGKKSANSKDLESDSDEYESDSGASFVSLDPDEIAKDRIDGDNFWYASPGSVLDDDGVDLGVSLLHSISWTRIVLDEAHKIKDRVNSTAKATLALQGGATCHRWCLTGTPLQNRVGELYSLIRFLRMDKYAFYYCKEKECQCKTLHWEARLCDVCGHPPMKHYSYFNKHVINPIKRNGHHGEGERAMKLLRDDVLGPLMLRRTKEERKEDINLPPCSIEIKKLSFSEHELDFYESVYKNSYSKFDTYVKKGTLMHNYAHIFELLSRLRRTCDHPYLVIHNGSNLDATNAANAKNSDVCGICQFDIEALEDCALAHCRHTFHKSCVEELFANSEAEETKPSCPLCMLPLGIIRELRGGTERNENALTEDDEDTRVCVVCMDKPRTALLEPCGHIYLCMECAKGLDKRSCPMCRCDIQRITRVDPIKPSDEASKSVGAVVGRKSIIQRIGMNQFASSTKVEGVISEVNAMLTEKRNDTNMPNKAIVFSQYNDMLDLLDWRLRNSGVRSVKLVGSLPVPERQSVLRAFKTDPSVNVILMSLKAGGEGLNLQEASHVIVIEPWWNPAVEMQAIQRAHRIGQKRPVKAIRFVIENSIEEKMMELQDKKSLVFDGAIDGSQAALAKLTAEDLKFLFSR